MATFALRIAFNLRQHRLDRGARAQDDDIGLRGLERLGRVGGDFRAEPLGQADDVAEIAADLGGIDVDRADNLETWPRRHLFDDRGTNRAEPEMHDFDVGHNPRIIRGW